MTDAPQRWHTWAAAALVACHATLAWIMRGSAAVTIHADEAMYVLLARALRHLSYRELFVVGAPIHAQYPPGFPAFLAAFSLPFGDRYDVLMVGIIAASAAALAILYVLVRRLSGPYVALVVLALSAFNPGLLESASKPYSEPLFMLGVFATLWAASKDSARWNAAAAAAAIAAALTRSAGVTLVFALFVVWVYQRHYRRAAWLAVSTLLTVGTWLAWTVAAPAKIVGRSYVADAAFVAPSAAIHAAGFAETLTRRVLSNGLSYTGRHVPWAMAVPTLSGTSVDNVIAVVFIVVFCATGLWLLRRPLPLLPALFAAYAALLLPWPWNGERFIAPLVPLLFWAMFEATSALSARVPRLKSLGAVVGVALLATAVTRDIDIAKHARACFRIAARDARACYIDRIRGFFKAADYLRDSTPTSAIVVSGDEALIAYQSDRAVLSSVRIGRRPPAATFAYMRQRHADYVLLTWLREPVPQLVPTMTEGCRELQVVGEYEETLLLRLPPPGVAPTGADACAAIARYAAVSSDRQPIP